MPEFLSYLSNLSKSPAVSRGALLSVIILILGGFSYFFLWHFLPFRLQNNAYDQMHGAFQFSFLSAIFSLCIILAFWALAMTYLVGPGFSREIFKSVRLDSIDAGEHLSVSEHADETSSNMIGNGK